MGKFAGEGEWGCGRGLKHLDPAARNRNAPFVFPPFAPLSREKRRRKEYLRKFKENLKHAFGALCYTVKKWTDTERLRMEEKRAEKAQAEEGKPAAVIRVRGLYKIYRVGETKVYALNGVDFDIYRGEFVAIVGTSGSGKSTLLNLMAGLEKPTKGEIQIGGRHIEKLSEKQLVAFRRQRVGFIFQSYNLLNTMNAIENVALPLSFRGVPKRERLRTAARYLALVGVEKQAKHMPNQMSGGQQQRVGIARALAVSPQIIFADEPTGNLDSKTTMEVLRLMQRIVREQGQTLVMVTHDNNLASYADRRIRIVDGKIVGIEEGGRTAPREE